MRQGEDLFTPSQLFQQTAQKDNTEDERGFGEWWNTRARFGQPAENMRFASQLFQAADLAALLAQATQKTPEGSAIVFKRCGTERSGELFGRTFEQRLPRMTDRMFDD